MKTTQDLAAFQHDFLAAALHGEAGASVTAITVQPGFAVYRNTIFKGCVDNLCANFPTVMRLVGEAWFRAAALEHARAAPPDNVSLFDYGAAFPAFLAAFPPAAALPYLADVARLDRAWIESHTAADAAPLTPAALAGIAPASLGALQLPVHPATRTMAFEHHPAGAIWIANRALRDVDALLPWRGDAVLLTRVDNAVQWQAIGHGAAAFLDACLAHAALQDAAAHALSVQADLDLAATLALLLQAGAFQTLAEEP